MSSMSLRLPESLHMKIRELAERDGISINQFIATAVAEKGRRIDDLGLSRGARASRRRAVVGSRAGARAR